MIAVDGPTGRNSGIDYRAAFSLPRAVLLFLLCPIVMTAGAAGSGQEPAAEKPGVVLQSGLPQSLPAENAVPNGKEPNAGGRPTYAAESGPSAAQSEHAPAMSLQPYTVRVELSCTSDSQLPADRIARLQQDVRNAVLKVYGEMWVPDVVMTSWLLPASRARLDRVQPAELAEICRDESPQKVMLVTIEAVAGAWQVCCREYDARVRELSPSRWRVVADDRAIAATAASLMRDSFRPVLFLTQAVRDSDEVELLLQAGEIPPPDPTAAQIAAGDVLQPYLRHMERREPTRVRLLQRLDLTWVRVTKFNQDLSEGASDTASGPDEGVTVPGHTPVENGKYPDQDRGRVSGVVLSHGLSHFGRRGRSVQQLALRLRPAAESSRVRLVLNQAVDRPLVSHRVDKVGKFRYQDQHEENLQQLSTDRRGEIELEVDPEHPTFWLYVYSGSLLLARVPYAPGLIPFDTIRLPDDSIRLGVEGELYLLRDQIVDVAAQRAVLNRIAEKAAADRDPERLAAAVRDLLELPGKREFDAALNAIRVPAVMRAKELRNRNAERTVEKLCNGMSRSIEVFFSSEKHLRELEKLGKLQDLAQAVVQPVPGSQP